MNSEGVAVVALDVSGGVVARAESNYRIHVPKPGWTEQDPSIWWHALIEACDVLGTVTSLHTIQGVGLTGQMHSTVVLDHTGAVLYPALLWNDQRSSTSALELQQIVDIARIKEITGNIMMPAFTAAKLQWIKMEQPEVFRKIRHVLMPKDYLRYKMTNVLATDVTDASGTGLFSVERREWSDELIEAFSFQRSWFPDALDSSSIAGRLTDDVSAVLGMKAGIPIIAGGGDNAVASIAAGIFSARKGLLRIGSAGSFIVTTEQPEIFRYSFQQTDSLHNFCHAITNLWYSMGNTLAAELSLHWLFDAVSVYARDDESWSEMVEHALEFRSVDDGLLFLPYLGGERTPYVDPKARGVFFGLHFRHDLRHMIRAVMEGVAFSMRDCLDIQRQSNLEVSSLRVVGEIIRYPAWCQILSDVLGLPLEIPYHQHSAEAAALLAGISLGVYDTKLITDRPWTAEYHPDREYADHYNRLHDTYKELYRSLARLF